MQLQNELSTEDRQIAENEDGLIRASLYRNSRMVCSLVINTVEGVKKENTANPCLQCEYYGSKMIMSGLQFIW